MLKIPQGKDLTVEASPDEEAYLLDVSRKWLEKEQRSEGVHVSELLDPMYAWHQKKDKKRKLTDREVTTFLIGKILHAFIISAADGADGVDWASDEGSRHSKELDIEYSIDYEGKDKIPTEIKTSRSFYPPKGIKDLETYLEQVLCYMVAENQLKGKLWILYLNVKDEMNRTCPQFRAYTITVTKKALADYKKQMVRVRSLYVSALKKTKPVGLELCREWKCSPRMCKYWETCKPKGRYEYGVNPSKWKN